MMHHDQHLCLVLRILPVLFCLHANTMPHDPIFIEVVPLPENPSDDVLMSLSKM